TNPLEFGSQANGAYLTVVGVWTSTSSRKFKDNIQPLDTQKAAATLKELRPVTYNYKIDTNEHHVGFIAEEVPDLIAAEGRKSIDPMNVTAILTSVLKQQGHDLQQQDAVLNSLESELQSLKAELNK
ncbi:MAG: tail fiber domain-containing protein, partial [Candidatus Omnitrophica bacterium]|nr:tail fiber domain-containing protein [Candidatus Omnitrophota bacterium]